MDWQTVDRDWQQYLDEAGSGWRQRFIPLMQGIIVEQGNDWNLRMGMEFDVRNLFAKKWFDDYTMKFASSTAESTREGMTGLLKQAMEEGWGIPNMQNNLGQMFDQWMYGGQSPGDFEWLSQRMPAYRLEMIARTETIRASNRGSNQLFAAWDVTEKEWLTTKDDRLCDWCAAMDGKIIPVGGNFFDQGSQFNVQVGDVMRTLKLDYEDVGTPPLHPDCRCTVLPVVDTMGRPLPGSPDAMRRAALSRIGDPNYESGISESILVNMGDEGRGIFKPINRDRGYYERKYGLVYSHQREEYAYRVAQSMGWDDLIPQTVLTEFGDDIGSLQRWVENAKMGADMSYKDWMAASQEDMRRISLFDRLIGNMDRNYGNYLMTDDGRIVAIDHGIAFLSEEMSVPIGSDILTHYRRITGGSLSYTEADLSAISKFLADTTLQKEMRRDLGDAAVDLIMGRARELLE